MFLTCSLFWIQIVENIHTLTCLSDTSDSWNSELNTGRVVCGLFPCCITVLHPHAYCIISPSS